MLLVCVVLASCSGAAAGRPHEDESPAGVPIIADRWWKQSKLLKARVPVDCDDVELVDRPSFAAVGFEELTTGTTSGCDRLEITVGHDELRPLVQKRLVELLECRSCEVLRVRGVQLRNVVLRVRYRDSVPGSSHPLFALMDERARPLDASAPISQAIFDHLDSSGTEVQATITGWCADSGRVATDCARYRRGLDWRTSE